MKKFLMVVMAVFFGLAAAQARSEEYEGKIPFKNSENVRIHFHVSKDGKEVQKILFNMKKLRLKPEGKKSGVDKVEMNDAGVEDKTVRKITNGKLTANAFFVFDLTVIDSCMYGTIGIRYKMSEGVMVADPVYVVIPNITNPKKIPDNILKP